MPNCIVRAIGREPENLTARYGTYGLSTLKNIWKEVWKSAMWGVT